ncbi:MAG: cytochrome-c oxidase [Gammaproteobacteria bacterium]
MATRFLMLAVVYFVTGVAMGVAMAATQDFTAMPVHAHVNLLGWVSLALAGMVYRLYPAAAATRLASFHFWVYNFGLPLTLVALFFLLRGHEALRPLVGVGAVATASGVFVRAQCMDACS